MLVRAMVLATFAFACACGGGNSYDDVGDVVEAYWSAVCNQLDDCDLLEGVSVDDCIDGNVAEECAAADCEGEIREDISDSEIDACIDDIDDVACDAEDPPASCVALFG